MDTQNDALEHVSPASKYGVLFGYLFVKNFFGGTVPLGASKCHTFADDDVFFGEVPNASSPEKIQDNLVGG